MKKEDLNKLSKEELVEVLTNFYNEIDKMFLDNRGNSTPFVVNELYAGYIRSTRKLLNTIKEKGEN